MTLSDS